MPARHSNLFGGYDNYESHHGTLVASTVTSEAFSDAVHAIEVTNLGATDIWISVQTAARMSPSNPTADGSSDTNDEFILVQPGESRAMDVRAYAVNLISSGTPDYMVLGLRN